MDDHHRCKTCGHHKSKELCKDKLLEWSVNDYTIKNGFKKDLDFGKYSTIYNSDMALKGEIFKAKPWLADYPPKYHLRNYRITFPPGKGVPGAFDYNRPYSQWGGDVKYGMGIYNYPVIISGFGHPHILTVQTATKLKRCNPKCSIVAEEMMLTRLANGSEQIFKWFAQLVNSDGNPIPYDVKTPAGALKGMMSQLISDPKPINLDNVYQMFNTFNKTFFGSNKTLTEIVDYTKESTDVILRNGQVDFLSWGAGMKNHQDHTLHTYDHYKAYYDAKASGDRKAFKKAKLELNMATRQLMDSGLQLASFFVVFHGATLYLDTALDLAGANSPPAIPPEYRIDRMMCFNSLSLSYWNQHVAMFNDFNMVAANSCIVDPEVEMYKITVSMLESCEEIADFLGELFSSFDCVVRERNLYQVMPPSFP